MKEILKVLDHRERAESIVSWSGLHLKYNAIFFYAGAGESASCQFFAASSERNATFSLPEYSENSGKCISITLSTHVETVVLLSKGMVDSRKVKVDFSLEDMDLSEFKGKATYEQIKTYVLEQTGLKVSSLYIAQIKKKCGLDVGENFNLPKSENARQPQCTQQKEEVIMQAFKHFGIV